MRELSSMEVALDGGIEGRVESISAGVMSISGDWSAGTELGLRPDGPVVVLTCERYEELLDNFKLCSDCKGELEDERVENGEIKEEAAA